MGNVPKNQKLFYHKGGNNSTGKRRETLFPEAKGIHFSNVHKVRIQIPQKFLKK